MAFALVLAIITFVITVASTAYQVAQQKAMARKAKAAAESRKGFEIPVEGTTGALPIVYGRGLIGGFRVWHNISSTFLFTTPNANKTLETGPQGLLGYTQTNYDFDTSRNAIVIAPTTVSATASGYLNQSISGDKNEFLYFQQALCLGPIQACHDVIIDESRFITDPLLGYTGSTAQDKSYLLRSAMRFDVNYTGGVADSIISNNFAERVTATFNGIAYASVTTRLNRDEPQFSACPNAQFLIEGRKVKKVVGGVLAGTRTYTNSPPFCLLDYLMEVEASLGMPASEFDLASFEAAAAICDQIVQPNAPVAGKIWRPTDGARTVTLRDLPLYECNIVIDTAKPVRDNVESILTTMGDARLIWSGGVYKLSMQYPATNAATVLADTLTDDDLQKDQTIQIAWPSGSERLNQCTVKFHNEHENFKEDVVSWPPKFTNSYLKGIGGVRYTPPPETGWDDSKASARLLNDFGVWDGAGSSTTLSYVFVVNNENYGTCTLEYAADDYCSISIYNWNTTTNVVGSLINTYIGSDWTIKYNGTLTLGDPVSDKAYKIVITANNTGGKKKAFAGRITKGVNAIWDSRAPAFVSTQTVNNDSAIYDALKLADGGLSLETEIFLEGCTDPYHALAKAEEMVRTSRSAFSINFKYNIKTSYVEPGDFTKVSSATLGMAGGDFIVRVGATKVTNDKTCEITGTRFDVSQLAWANKDDVWTTPAPVYSVKLPTIGDITYSPYIEESNNSSGLLTWADVTCPGFTCYVVYAYQVGVDAPGTNNFPVYTEIGRCATGSFVLPAIASASAIFAVRIATVSGAMSDFVTTDKASPIVLNHTWTKGVSITSNVNPIFKKDAVTGTVSPSSIILTATLLGFTAPIYQWYLDGSAISGATSATLTVASFTSTNRKSYSVQVQETSTNKWFTDTLVVNYLDEASASWPNIAGSGKPDDNATVADNLQINALMTTDATGYNNTGGTFNRAAGVTGAPTAWVQSSTGATIGGGGQLIYPLSKFAGGKKLFISFLVYRSAGLTTLDFAANVYNALTGAGIGPFASGTIVPTSSGVWQLFKFSGDTPIDAGYIGITIYNMTGNTGTVQIGAPVISYTEGGADITKNNMATLTVPSTQLFNADYTGTILGGQVPKVVKATRKMGDTDVSSSTTWSLTVVSGCTATIASTGFITISGVSTTGKIEVTSVRDGITLKDEFAVKLDVAQPPIILPSGGGSGTAPIPSAITSTSYGSADSAEITVTAGAAGTVTLTTGPIDFIVTSGSGTGSYGLVGIWQSKPVGGGYTDVAAEQHASADDVITYNAIDAAYEHTGGWLSVSMIKTGLTPGTQYVFRLRLKNNSVRTRSTSSGLASAVVS